MATYCIKCHDNLFRYRCRQCRKPVCEECAFQTEHGTFCSHRCAARFRDFTSKQVADRGRGEGPSLVRTVLVLILVGLIVLAVAWWNGWLPESVDQMVTDLLSKFL